MSPSLSVIIPALNEEKLLAATLDRLCVEPDTEIILVDGGSTDRTTRIAGQYPVLLLASAKGRARQMNTGAARAKGEILFFCHADTLVPPGYKKRLETALTGPDTVAGAFSLAIALDGPLIRLVEFLANHRARSRQLPFGDQGLFLAASRFHLLGGFSDIPLLEDVVLIEKLRYLGSIAIVEAAVISSGRRWQKNGVLLTSLTNQLILLGYRCGISPIRLARLYQRLGR